MDRLTYKSFMGDYGSNKTYEDDFAEKCALRNALGKYEDLGCTPEQLQAAMEIKIDYKDFEKHLQDVIDIINLQDNISNLGSEFGGSEYDFLFPTLADNVIALLANLTNDKDKWIEYFIYELYCGEKAEEYKAFDGNNNVIPLRTIADLWEVLQRSNRGEI